MFDLLDEHTWLYRGVPIESSEIADVENNAEVRPLRPGRIGVEWRRRHSIGMTDTGYTSWSSDRSIAEAAASACCDYEGLSGRVRMLRVRVDSLDSNRVFEGRMDEDEYLIQGTVENVEFAEGADDE